MPFNEKHDTSMDTSEGKSELGVKPKRYHHVLIKIFVEPMVLARVEEFYHHDLSIALKKAGELALSSMQKGDRPIDGIYSHIEIEIIGGWSPWA